MMTRVHLLSAAAILVVLIPGQWGKAVDDRHLDHHLDRHQPYKRVNPDRPRPQHENPDIWPESAEADPSKGHHVIPSESLEDLVGSSKEYSDNSDTSDIDKGFELNIKPQKLTGLGLETQNDVKPEEPELQVKDEAEAKPEPELLAGDHAKPELPDEDDSSEQPKGNVVDSQEAPSEAQDQGDDVKQEEADLTEGGQAKAGRKQETKTGEDDLAKQANYTEAMRQLKEAVIEEESKGSAKSVIGDLLVSMVHKMVDDGMITPEQLEDICDWICVNFPCPPDCPGYYEPPWG